MLGITLRHRGVNECIRQRRSHVLLISEQLVLSGIMQDTWQGQIMVGGDYVQDYYDVTGTPVQMS